MATANKVEYHVFAVLDFFNKRDPIGTTTEVRGGVWYVGKLLATADLAESFGDNTGLPRASDVTLRIADGPTGDYRGDVLTGGIAGTSAIITQVIRETTPSGVVTEVTKTKVLTVTGYGLSPSEVTVKCSDIEEKKLDALYPPLIWRASDWPQLRDTDAGKSIAYPVGTALKIPCPQLVADDTNLQYFFGVCTGTPKLLAITSINSGAKQVTISGTTTDVVQAGQVIYITGSTLADGRYTVTVVNSTTVFTVAETLPASTGGSVRLMPHVLTVYRSGRVIDPSEYTVIHVAAAPALVNGNFASNSFTGWTVNITGAGTADASTGKAVLTQPSTVNTASIQQTIPASKGLWTGVALDVGATSTVDVRISSSTGSYDLARNVALGGRRAALFCATSTNAANGMRFGFGAGGAQAVNFDNVATWQTDMVAILFTRPQVDFQGSAYVIEADVRGVESRNAATEVSRLLSAAGVAPDGASFTAAASVASTNKMLVDCDYGRSGQRTIRAILDDHLFLLRGCITRSSTGSYVITQDVAGVAGPLIDESLGDSLEVSNVQWDGAPSSVSITYRPGATDPGVLQETIRRGITGGLLGDDTPRDMRYVRDHETADRLLCYLALRGYYNGRCAATIYRQQYDLGAVLTLGSPLNWGSTPRTWSVRGVQRIPRANKLDLLEYNAAVYTYTATTPLPTDAVTIDYEPDYSQTPPAAPSALTITATAVALTADGTSNARVTVRCAPPATNWTQIWFTVIHNVTGEVIITQGADIGGGLYGTTLTGLRPGNVYQLKAYAVNVFNLQGALQGTFNATAIGGGAAVTTFTTPGYATLPPNVASITATQGTGLIVQVAWPAVSLAQDVLGDYILERKIGLGSFGEVWRGRANGYTDRNFTQYGLAVTYRVRASDRWGNLSAAYATSGTVTLSRTVYGGNGVNADINDNTVGTVNRTGVSTVSVGFSTPAPQDTISFSHSLGVIPLVTYDCFGKNTVWVGIGTTTTSSVNANVNSHTKVGLSSTTSNNSVAGDPHTHTLNYAWPVNSGTVNFYLW